VSSTGRSLLPNLQTLTVGLTSILRSHGSTNGQVTILDRQPNIRASTFPSEIVTCRFDDGSELRLFCKYGRSPDVFKGGVPYEAEVYRHVLQPSRASTSTFYGAYEDMTTGDTWLILEYLDNSLRVHRIPGLKRAAAMTLAARWIGQFHAINEALFSGAPMPSLITYDAEYYLGWVHRTSLQAGHFHQRFPWLTTLCERFEELVAPLLASPQTVIHGEYYPVNVLFRGGTVCPIDWETAAVAAGEIDLAALTSGRWSAEVVRKCELEYQRTRWPEGSPADFEQTLCAARLYLHFRWLGRPNWTIHAKSLHHFEQLRSAGERLGLIGALSQ
jgi:Phosphotransferase enzyme family